MRRAVLFGFLALLSLSFAGAYLVARNRRPVKAAAETIQRFRRGRETPAERRALARAAAELCGFPCPPAESEADPHLAWADFIPGGDPELAIAAQISPGSGFLALLAAAGSRWRLLCRLGPEELGAPTSLSVLIIPGRAGAALVMTDLADQMAGAFCRREDCTVFGLRDGEWRRLWRREIESEAYWNLAWDHPPGRGWVRLAGRADWQVKRDGKGCRILVTYRNSSAVGPPGARLPESHHFTEGRQMRGEEEYRWDPRLDLFVLGYGRLKGPAELLGPGGRSLVPPVSLPSGLTVAVLADEAATPKALSGRECLLRVNAAGREGFLPSTAVAWPLR